MPVVNASGLIVMNAVNGPLSNGAGVVLVSPAGLGCFLSGSTAICQDLRSGACLSLVDVSTGHITPNINPLGCNVLVAGGGVWAAFGGGTAYRDSHGTLQADWRPIAVDDVTGRVFVSLFDGGASGLGWWDGVTLTTLPYSGMPLESGSASGGIAVVQVNARPLTFPDQGWPSLPILDFAFSGGWLCGWDWVLNGLVAWQAGSSPLGYLLAQNVNRFASDVSVLPSGRVRVVASVGAGQLPGELLTYDIDPVFQTVNGLPVTLVDLTTGIPEPPDPPVPPIPPIPPIPPQPPVETDDMMTIYANHMERFWEDPTKWVLKGGDGRYLQINLEWEIIWRTGVNHAGPGAIESDSAITWAGGPTATMVRNGCTERTFKVV